MLKGVHHIAILVKDLDAATHLYVDVLGGTLRSRKYFDPSGVEVSLVGFGNVIFELVLPVREGTDSHRFLQEHGPGFYHLGLEVDEIESNLAALEAAGVGLIDRKAVPGVDWDVAWLQTESMLGVPSQLIRPKGGPAK